MLLTSSISSSSNQYNYFILPTWLQVLCCLDSNDTFLLQPYIGSDITIIGEKAKNFYQGLRPSKGFTRSDDPFS